jgi:hypothetical protein
MDTRKSLWILFGTLVISVWFLGSPIQAGAETMNFNAYNVVTKRETVPVADVEGHALGLTVRNGFFIFENKEVAASISVGTHDYIKGKGPFMQYVTLTFQDGSTIIIKSQGAVGTPVAGTPTVGGYTGSEIIKGTGRFEGIKGSVTLKVKYLPVEKWEAGPKAYAEGTITYSLPPK